MEGLRYQKQTYMSDFLKLKCAGDVLNVVNPLGSKAEKEITESMAIIKKLRKIVLAKPNYYYVFDLCAGNALTSVLSAFLLPIKKAIAIDKRPRERNWHLAKKFSYITDDIYNVVPSDIGPNAIIIGVHACNKLAEQIIKIYKESDAEHLLLMPCCIGNIKSLNVPQPVIEKIGKYMAWAWQLAQEAGGDFFST